MRKVTPQVIGADANIAAAKLAKTLDKPLNLGIGTMPGHSYQPIDPQTFKQASEFLLGFLGLKNKNLNVVPAKGGGSGAISVGIAVLRSMGYRPQFGAFSAWDWTGYESFCSAQGLEKKYMETDEYDLEDPDALVFIQTNRNGNGTRLTLEKAEALIELNNRLERPNFIDLPYFTGSEEERSVLKLFQEKSQVPTIIAWSPTKIFQTFAARPGGAVIVIHPNEAHFEALGWAGGVAARGTTGFDDAVTRELWEAMAFDQSELKQRHQHYLQTVQTATECWRRNAPADFETYFDDALYGGMFRLFPAQAETQKLMAAENIVPVLMQNGETYKVRVNICGVVQADGSLIPEADTLVAKFFDILTSYLS